MRIFIKCESALAIFRHLLIWGARWLGLKVKTVSCISHLSSSRKH